MTVRPHRRHRDPRVPPRRSSLETRVTRREIERGEARGSWVAAPRARSTLGRALWPSCGGAARRAGPARLVGNSGAVCSVGAPARPVLTPGGRRSPGPVRGGLPPAVARRRGCAFMLSACGPLLARLGRPTFHVKSEPTPGAVRAGIIARRRTARACRGCAAVRAAGPTANLTAGDAAARCPAAWRGARVRRPCRRDELWLSDSRIVTD